MLIKLRLRQKKKKKKKKNFSYIKTCTRSSHQRCSIKNSVLRNFTKFTGKHLRQSLFFNKVVGLRLATLLKKRLWHRCFPLNFAKFLRISFLQDTSGRLLLVYVSLYSVHRWKYADQINSRILEMLSFY